MSKRIIHIYVLVAVFLTVVLFILFSEPVAGVAERVGIHGVGQGRFGVIWLALFWIAMTAVIAFVVQRLCSPGHRDPKASPEESPLKILEKRFASGDIDQQEFEDNKKLLS